MIRNYLKIAWRNIVRHKGYSAITISGLAIGMACCLLLSLYVVHELSYDGYHDGSDRIYRVVTSKQTPSEVMQFSGASPLLLPVLREESSEVDCAFDLQSLRPSPVKRGTAAALETGLTGTDDGVFKVLRMPFIYGRPEGSLMRPRTTVLTRSVARTYFGDDNPVGRTLQIDTILFEVTGVVADQPTNTHLKFRILCSSTTKWYSEEETPPVGWNGPLMPTYLKLVPGADPNAFEARIKNLPTERGREEQKRSGETYSFSLQPITAIHLSPALRWEVEPPGNPVYVFGMAATALLVLLIACVNFLNLSTARASIRAMEVGIRKAAGAHRPQLFWQFMGESFLMTLAALVVALPLAEIAIPWLNATTGIIFSRGALLQPAFLLIALGVVLLVSFLAGCYPALFLSAIQPVRALKGRALTQTSRKLDLRKVLVVGQLVVVGILAVGVVTVYRQTEFMRNRPLGFDKEQKLVIELPRDGVGPQNFETIKQTFRALPAVAGATISTSVPGRWNYQWRTQVSGKEAEGQKRVNWYGVDGDFIKEYGIEMAAGEPFRPAGSSPGSGRGLLVNEAAVREFGWESNEKALGQKLNNGPVVGVFKDFHFRGLQIAVEPLTLFRINEDYRYLSLRVNTGELHNTISAVETAYKHMFPDGVFNYFFLDADFDKQYQAEENMGRICAAFTIVGIFVAYLGLYALAVFLAQRRTKEIGVRKVLGASTPSMVLLLLVEFVPLLAVAAVIAAPVAYLVMGKWLQQFAYRIDNSIVTVILFVVTAVCIVGVSISVQAIKAARANPVDSLKCE